MESLEDRVNDSKEIKNEGFLTRIGRNKWLRRTMLSFAFPFILEASGCGDEKSTGSTSTRSQIVESRSTNLEGKTVFTEERNQEDIVVSVITKRGNPIPNFSIIYFDGDNSEIFMGYDPKENYMPSIRIASHNSQQTLYTDEVKRGIIKLQTIEDEEGMRALLRFENKFLPRWTEYIYEETIDESESIKIYEKNMAYVKFADEKVFSGLKPAQKIFHFFGVKLPLPFQALAPYLDPYGKRGSKRWDVYRVKGGSESVFPLLVPDYLEVVESNIPTIRVNDPRIEGNKVTFSWRGSDKTFYDKPFSEIWDEEEIEARPDMTVLLGRTRKSDLSYTVTLENTKSKEDQDYFHRSQVVEGDKETVAIFENLPDSIYRIYVKVQDEVQNSTFSDTLEFRIRQPDVTMNVIPSISRDRTGRSIYPLDTKNKILYTNHPSRKGFIISIVDANSGESVNLTEYKEGVYDQYPSWSPDGSMISFARLRGMHSGKVVGDIYLLDTKTGRLRNVTNLDAGINGPEFSRDGRRILFSKEDVHPINIYSVDLNGQGLRSLTTNGGIGPSWSSIEDKILFFSFKEDKLGICDIYVMNADGSNERNLTNTPDYHEFSPSWSPDGREIAYANKFGNNAYLFIMNSDGSNKYNTGIKDLSFSLLDGPSWSPDGSKIVVNRYIKHAHNLYVYDRFDKTLKRLTRDTNSEWEFGQSWSPH